MQHRSNTFKRKPVRRKWNTGLNTTQAKSNEKKTNLKQLSIEMKEGVNFGCSFNLICFH